MRLQLKFLGALVASFGLAGIASATVTLSPARALDARDSGGTEITLGTLGLVVVDTGGDGFNQLGALAGGTSINIGDFIGDVGIIPDGANPDNDLIVNRITYAEVFGVNQLPIGPTTFAVDANAAGTADGMASTGDQIAVYWFPGLTTETTIAAGQSYGTTRDPGATDPWVVPSDGNTEPLATVNSAGNATLTVIPEPTAGFLVALGGLLFAFRRSKRP